MKTVRTFDDAIVIILSRRQAKRYAEMLRGGSPLSDTVLKQMLADLEDELTSLELNLADYGFEVAKAEVAEG